MVVVNRFEKCPKYGTHGCYLDLSLCQGCYCTWYCSKGCEEKDQKWCGKKDAEPDTGPLRVAIAKVKNP